MTESRRFEDRTAAGRQLGEALLERDIDADIVLAIPRGGLPLGRAVADALDAPLDVVVASKIGAPGNPEYAIGAVSSDGTEWRNEEAFRRGGITDDYFERKRDEEAERAATKAKRYRGDTSSPDVTGQSVVVVDDGVATGSTAMACLQTLGQAAPSRIVLAVPVGPPDTIETLSAIADEVICLVTPERFRGVGGFYERFDQVSDEEAIQYLAE